MAEATLNDVIERLRAEGQLTRNTGSYSIKSVKVEVKSILQEQTDILKKMLNVMTGQVEEAARQTAIEKAGKTVTESKGVEEKEKGKGLLSKIFDPSIEEGKRIGSVILAPILNPLRGLMRLVMRGGPIAIAVGLLFSVFKDIAENETFINALENIKRVWNESIVPTFERLKESFDNFMASESGAVIIENALKIWENVRASLQKFVVDIINNIFSAIEGILDGVNMIIDGDFLGGIGKITNALLNGLIGLADSLLTAVLEIFGVNFGEDGTFVAWADRKLSEITNGLKEKFSSFLGFFTETIPQTFNNIVDFFNEKFADIRNFIETAWNSIVDEEGIFGIIFKPIKSAVDVIKDLFAFGEEDMTALGLIGKLTDLVYAPVNMAINFVRGIFGFEESDEPFKLQDFIQEKISSIIGSIAQIFSFIPSISDIRDSFLDRMPNWMRKLVGAPEDGGMTEREIAEQGLDALQRERQAMIDSAEMAAATSGVFIAPDTSGIDQQISNLQSTIENMPEYNSGTKGFMDFGMGTPAMLHGIEAVVPRQTPAGEFLAANFDDNFQPIMDRISGVESAAMASMSQAPIIVTNAPTVAPITNNIGGSTNVSSQRINTMGTGNGGSGLGRFAN